MAVSGEMTNGMNTDTENLIPAETDKTGQLSDGLRMALALDSLGFNMDRLEEDGSYKVSGNDLAFGEGQALGIFAEDGNLNMDAAMTLLDTKYDDMSDDQKKTLDDVMFLNQNVMSFAQAEDGTLLKDTKEGQSLGEFMEQIDEVDDLKDFQGQNFVQQKMTTAEIVNGAMKNQDTLSSATIVLDADTMKQFKDYQAGVMPEQNVENSVESVDKSDEALSEDMKTQVDGAAKSALDNAKDVLGAGMGVAAGAEMSGISGENVANKLRDTVGKARDFLNEKSVQLKEFAGDLKEDMSERIQESQMEQPTGAAFGAAAGAGVAGVVGDSKDGIDGEAEPVEGEVVEDVLPDGSESLNVPLYQNEGDTNVTINIYADGDSQMSMLDMAKQQMEQMGIDMSDEKNPEIPEWYGDMQKWMAEREAGGVSSPDKNLKAVTLVQKGKPEPAKQMPAREGERYEQAYQKLGNVVDKVNDTQASVGMEL